MLFKPLQPILTVKTTKRFGFEEKPALSSKIMFMIKQL